MPITATGIGSGLDVESLVSQLILADIQPTESRLNRNEASYQAQLTAYGSVKGALAAFQSSVASASASVQYIGKSASTTLFDTVTASADSSAVEGDYAIAVSALASAQSLATSAFASTTETVGTGTLSIALGTVTYDTVAQSVTGFAAKADTTAVSITIDSSNNTLAGVRDAINAADAGAAASIVNDGSGYRLVLQGEGSGAENAVTISVTDTGDGDSTDTAGLSQLAFDQTTSNVAQTNAANDAALTINGLAVTSASNTVASAVEGVTFTLKKTTTEPVTISVAKDTAKAKAGVDGLVAGFNAINAKLNSLTSFNAATTSGSLLTGDATLRSLSRTIQSSLNAAVAGSGGLYSTLAELGITTNVIDGSLSVDSTKLDAILANDPADVAKVLASFGTPTNANVQYVSSTTATEVGTYAVAGTTTSTAGALTAGSAITVTSYNGGGNNAVFSVSVDSATAVQVTLSNNDSTTTEVLNRINTALASAGVTASLANDILTFTSDSTGTSSSVEITAADANAIAGLGITVGAGTAGTTSTAYTINGSAVTTSDDVITGGMGTAVEGLSLKILGNATGDLGSVGFTLGVASPLNSLITQLLADDGLIDAKLDGLANSVSDITSQRESLALRADALEKRYRNQFNGLEILISQLNTTQSFLTTALNQFVDPLSFRK
jgi:flagellar hook-associated protein 2